MLAQATPVPTTEQRWLLTHARPSRLTFAQVCIWCGQRWCEAAECIGRHERSLWTVCDTCEGFAVDCGCCHGLIEANPAFLRPSAAGCCR
jgi:hypothetical protein